MHKHILIHYGGQQFIRDEVFVTHVFPMKCNVSMSLAGPVRPGDQKFAPFDLWPNHSFSSTVFDSVPPQHQIALYLSIDREINVTI